MEKNERAKAAGGLWTRDFLLIWQGAAESQIGSVLYSVGIGVWVYDQTNSAGLMGLMTAISYLGTLVLQPLGGVLADRYSKRAMIAGSDAVCGAVMLGLGVLAWQGRMQVWQVLGVAAVSAVCSSVLNPAVNSLLPRVVADSALMQASALLNGSLNALRMIGNAAGGFFVALFGVPALILFNGLTFLFSAATECFIRAGGRPDPAGDTARPAGGLLRDLGEGAAYLRRMPGLLRIVLAGAAVNLTCGGFSGIVYVWCLEKGMTVPQYGLFLGAESGAMLAGMLLMGLCPPPPRRRWAALVATVAVQSVFYIGAMAAQGFWLCTGLYAVNALCNAVSNSFMYPAVAASCEPAYLGRVLALFNALCAGGVAVSMLCYGPLADRFGAGAVCLGGAVATVIPYLVFALDRDMRRLLEQ